MVDRGVGDYFISDPDDASFEDDDLLDAPVVVPVVASRQAAPTAAAPAAYVPAASVPTPAAAVPAVPVAVAAPAAAPAAPPVQVAAAPAAGRPASREDRLGAALGELMREDTDVQAAALVSLDGFTMASALPAGMQADRVGAMSAAILGLGERAAAELGRGHLSQVFIEGEGGYVVLIAAGGHAVLTAMAGADAKLGLVLYDMKAAAEKIGAILG